MQGHKMWRGAEIQFRSNKLPFSETCAAPKDEVTLKMAWSASSFIGADPASTLDRQGSPT